MKRILGNKKGFSLLEAILSLVLISLLIEGLFMSWYIMEKRERGLDQYDQAKQALEMAYAETLRDLRGKATQGPPAINATGTSITFRGTDGTDWGFAQVGNNYCKTHNLVTENLIEANSYYICSYVSLTYDSSTKLVHVSLEVSKPSLWSGDANSLRIDGVVYVRN